MSSTVNSSVCDVADLLCRLFSSGVGDRSSASSIKVKLNGTIIKSSGDHSAPPSIMIQDVLQYLSSKLEQITRALPCGAA